MELVDKIRMISEREADYFKYIPHLMTIGHCAEVFNLAKVPKVNPIPEEYFDAVLDGLCDSFYGGCEPEFETEEEYDRYEEMVKTIKSLIWITPKTEREKRRSPYQDKNRPFLGLPKYKDSEE